MGLILRQATLADVSRIITISAQVWDGEDYVGRVIDEWMADPRGAIIVAVLDGVVVGFARWVTLWPGYLWLEGLRVDPACRNQGIARALTRYLLELARLQGVARVGLSTYIENHASIRVIEALGFERVSSFVYLEAGSDAPARACAARAPEVQALDTGSALDFIYNSAFMKVSRGFFPHGWKFFPFAIAPEMVFARMRWVLGICRGADIEAVLCAGHRIRHQQEFTIDFVDGDPDAVETLVRHALALAQDARSVEVMLPQTLTESAAALPVLQRLGFAGWNDYAPDVFVYERTLNSGE